MVGTSLYAFLSLFFLIAVTRINGIETAGFFSYAFAISLVAFYIAVYGGRLYQVSDLDKEFSDSLYYSSRIITSVITIFISIAFILINNYDLYKSSIIILFVLTRVIEALSDTTYGIFQKNNRLDYVGISLTIKSLVSLILFLAINLITQDILLSVLSIFIVNLVFHVLFDLILVRKYERIQIEFINVKQLLYSTRYIFMFSLVIILIINTPRYIIDLFLDYEMQGIFAIIIMIPTIVLLLGQFVIQPITLRLSTLNQEKRYQAMSKELNHAVVMITLMALVATALAYFIGTYILNLLYGFDFTEYKMMIVISVISGFFYVLSVLYSTALTIMRKIQIQLILYFITFVLAVILTYIFTDLLGVNGTFISYVLVMLFQFILFFSYYKYVINRTISLGS